MTDIPRHLYDRLQREIMSAIGHVEHDAETEWLITQIDRAFFQLEVDMTLAQLDSPPVAPHTS